MNRTVNAFLVVPLVPSVLFAVLVSVFELVSGGLLLLPAVIYSFPIWLMFALPVSYFAAVVVGIPAFLVFRHFGWLFLPWLVLGASAIGVVTGLVIAFLFTSSHPLELGVIVLLFALFGAVSGYAFWRLACRAPNPPLNTDAPPSGAPVS